MSTSSVRSVVLSGLLVALGVVLTRFFGIMVPIAGILGVRISFGEIPAMMAGFILGPLMGGLVGALIDFIGAILFPIGPYFPGFTLSWFILGALPSIILKFLSKKRMDTTIRFFDLLIAVLITGILASVVLDTIWLNVLSGKSILILLPPRIIVRSIMIPIDTLMLYSLRTNYYLAQNPNAIVNKFS